VNVSLRILRWLDLRAWVKTGGQRLFECGWAASGPSSYGQTDASFSIMQSKGKKGRLGGHELYQFQMHTPLQCLDREQEHYKLYIRLLRA
jgi:hypothetical protein